ncbi:vrR-nuc domain [Caudoviricetes sp.]|nr:vrR-nuc domain [Caudoviricetes sp.]UOF82784.1 vrR-nuc domain [Caudoviricetes sp.]
MTFKIHGHLMQAGGWPDTYVAHPMWRGWIEFKVDGNNLDPRQRAIGEGLIKRGDRFVVARFVTQDNVMQIEDVDENLLSVLGFSMLDAGSAVLQTLRKASNL